MPFLFVYITVPGKKEAESISDVLIREKLVACTNIIDPMTALFWWNGELQQENEAVLVAKTTERAFPLLESRVKELHPYDCPCIIGLPITMGNPSFLSWIDQTVESEGKTQ